MQYYIPLDRFMWPVGSVIWPALARFRTSDHLKGRANRTDRVAEGPPPPSPPSPTQLPPLTTPTPPSSSQPTTPTPASSPSRSPPPGAGGRGGGERGRGRAGGGARRPSAGCLAHADRVRDIVEAAVGVRIGGSPARCVWLSRGREQGKV